MASYAKGSSLSLEVKVKERDPHENFELADPSSGPAITVTDPNSTEKLTAGSMTKAVTGKYYYLLQTSTTWVAGVYTVQVIATKGSYDAIINDTYAFRLK